MGNPEAGRHLRTWRRRRGLSQLAVALECGTSTRHLSFVETGRARASKDLVLHLARVLRPTNRELTACLLAAGHSPLHLADLDRDAPALDGAIVEMIDRHDPNPAFAFSADWVVEHMNEGARWLFSELPSEAWGDEGGDRGGIDMIAAFTHPEGVLARARDAPRVGATILRQLRAEQLTNPRLTDRIDAFERSLVSRYPGHPMADGPLLAEPAFHVDVESSHGPLSFLTVQVVVGMAQHLDIAAPRAELLFPSDARTRSALAHHVAAC